MASRIITLQKGQPYYLGASSGPTFIIIESETDRDIRYWTYPWRTVSAISRSIGIDLILRGTETRIKALRESGPLSPAVEKMIRVLENGLSGRFLEVGDGYDPRDEVVVRVKIQFPSDLTTENAFTEFERHYPSTLCGYVDDGYAVRLEGYFPWGLVKTVFSELPSKLPGFEFAEVSMREERN